MRVDFCVCVYLTCAHTDTRVYKAHAPVENPHFQTEEFKSRKDSLCDLEPASPLGVGLVRSVSLSRVRGKGRWLPVGRWLHVGHVRRPRWASPHGPDSAVPGPVPSPWTQRHGPCRPRLRDWSKDTAIARDVTGQQMHRRRHRLRTPGWSEVAGSGPGACGEPRSPSTLGGRRLPCSPLGHSLS